MPDSLEFPQQVIRATVYDHILEPDALRGSEHVLAQVRDGDGNRIDIADEERARAERQAEAVQTRAPLRVASSSSMTSPSGIEPVNVSESKVGSLSPNVANAPVVSDYQRTPPVVTESNVDWQTQARQAGWSSPNAPRDLSETHGYPPSDQPVASDPDFRPSPGALTPPAPQTEGTEPTE